MYEPQSFFKKFIEFSTWGSLVLLIPLAVVGFLSETALPASPLYAVKRGIENLVLHFESFDKNTQALYTVYLVDRRFFETEKVITDDPIELSTQNVDSVLTQITQARDSINSVSDAQVRLSLRQKLLQNIIVYRNQLAILQPPVLPAPQSSIQNTLVTNGISPQPTPFVTPVTSAPPSQQQNGQISILNQQLQQVQAQIQQDQNSNVYVPNLPTASIEITPTPTESAPTPFTQSQFVSPTPTGIPNSTLTPTGIGTVLLSPSPTSDGGGFILNSTGGLTPTGSVPSDTPTPTQTPGGGGWWNSNHFAGQQSQQGQ